MGVKAQSSALQNRVQRIHTHFGCAACDGTSDGSVCGVSLSHFLFVLVRGDPYSLLHIPYINKAFEIQTQWRFEKVQLVIHCFQTSYVINITQVQIMHQNVHTTRILTSTLVLPVLFQAYPMYHLA